MPDARGPEKGGGGKKKKREGGVLLLYANFGVRTLEREGEKEKRKGKKERREGGVYAFDYSVKLTS